MFQQPHRLNHNTNPHPSSQERIEEAEGNAAKAAEMAREAGEERDRFRERGESLESSLETVGALLEEARGKIQGRTWRLLAFVFAPVPLLALASSCCSS